MTERLLHLYERSWLRATKGDWQVKRVPQTHGQPDQFHVVAVREGVNRERLETRVAICFHKDDADVIASIRDLMECKAMEAGDTLKCCQEERNTALKDYAEMEKERDTLFDEAWSLQKDIKKLKARLEELEAEKEEQE